jgi:SsrA-binding protein
MKQQSGAIKIVANNKRAAFDYHLSDRFEAGLVLTGTEIKSIRAGRVNLRRSFVQNRGGELWLLEAHIAPYEYGSHINHDPTRARKLLLHRKEINKIIEGLAQKGQTVVPTKLYLKGGLAKLEIALAKGKRIYDKRQAIAKRDADRQVDRTLRRRHQ